MSLESGTPAIVETPDRFRLVASRAHTIRFVAVFLGVTALLAVQARQGQHAPAGAPQSHVVQYASMLVFLWAMLWFALAGLRSSGTTLREIIGGRWRSVADVLVTLATSVAFLLVAHVVLTAIKNGLSSIGQSAVGEEQRTMAFLGPHGPVEIALWILLSISAGFCEEVVFRGYLQRQFAALTRNEVAGLVISALIFGAGHAYQGWRSVVVIAVYGLLFGLLARFTRTLRPGIVAHALEDITSGLFPGF